MKEHELEVVKRVLVAHEEPPIEDMERLIALARQDATFREELSTGAAEVLSADPASLVPCWLALVVGEMEPPNADLLLSTLGTSEERALDETIVPVLTRQALPLFDDILRAIDEAPADDRDYRLALYEVLTAVAAGNDEGSKERLRRFAAERVEKEQRLPHDIALIDAPAALLAALTPAGSDRTADAEARLARAARVMSENWRHTARRIAEQFRPKGALSD